MESNSKDEQNWRWTSSSVYQVGLSIYHLTYTSSRINESHVFQYSLGNSLASISFWIERVGKKNQKGRELSPTMWVPGVELSSSDLAASAFTHRAI